MPQKNRKMLRFIFVFYFLIIIPPPLLVFLVTYSYVSSLFIVISIFVFGLIYLPILYSQRLSQLGVMSTTTYFKKVYLRNELKYLDILFLGKKINSKV